MRIRGFPFTYLGIPIHHRKLTNREWKCIKDWFEKKLSCWKGKLMSYGDRLILINSVLTSMPIFLLSFFEVPVGVRKRLDFYRSRFFGRVMNLRESIDSPSGMLFVDQRTKGVCVSRILRSRTDACLVSGCISYQLRVTQLGDRFSVTSICIPKLCHRWQWDQLIRRFGRGLWELRQPSLIEQSLLSVMATISVSGRILGLVIHHWHYSTQLCIVLSIAVMR